MDAVVEAAVAVLLEFMEAVDEAVLVKAEVALLLAFVEAADEVVPI